jgi:hypothetical protein
MGAGFVHPVQAGRRMSKPSHLGPLTRVKNAIDSQTQDAHALRGIFIGKFIMVILKRVKTAMQMVKDSHSNAKHCLSNAQTLPFKC